MKKNCFACPEGKNTCSIMNKPYLCDLGRCAFFKTKEQAKIDREKAEQSLLRRGLVKYEYEKQGVTHVGVISISKMGIA